MKPRIEKLNRTLLAGCKVKMSFTNNRTGELWREFMPLRSRLKAETSHLYSVEIYEDTHFFRDFDPNLEFVKWAAVKVKDAESVSDEFKILEIPEGKFLTMGSTTLSFHPRFLPLL